MAIDWTKEQITSEEFFSLPQEERLKIIARHIPAKIKIPFFTIGIFGILLNCMVSAFIGTVVFNHMLLIGYSEFIGRFLSLALSLFSVQILNIGMNNTGKWFMDKVYMRRIK